MNNVRKIWENSNITEPAFHFDGEALFDERLSSHTTFRVGGPADLFLLPATVDALRSAVCFLKKQAVPVHILGGGSNLLVADRGVRGAVLSLAALNGISVQDQASPLAASPDRPLNADTVLVRSGAGATVEDLLKWCAECGLSGLERLGGLPGSVGGAVFMNARCYDFSVSDAFFGADFMEFSPAGCTLNTTGFEAGQWDYKRSPFQRRSGSSHFELAQGEPVIVSAVFSLRKGDSGCIRSEIERFIQDRETKGHYRFPSAGSMFKNNHAFGSPSGKIIDEAGLRGFRIGGAQVAPWHGNIVINADNATAEDIRLLVEQVRSKVFAQTGFMLETEVVFAGEW